MRTRDFTFYTVRQALEPQDLDTIQDELEGNVEPDGKIASRYVPAEPVPELEKSENVLELTTETPGNGQEYTELQAYVSPSEAAIYASVRDIHSDAASQLQSSLEERYPETVEGEPPKDRKGYEIKL